MHYDRFCELFGYVSPSSVLSMHLLTSLCFRNVQIHLKSNSRLNNVVVERIQVGSFRALLLFTLAQGAQTIPVYPKPSPNLPETMTVGDLSVVFTAELLRDRTVPWMLEGLCGCLLTAFPHRVFCSIYPSLHIIVFLVQIP